MIRQLTGITCAAFCLLLAHGDAGASPIGVTIEYPKPKNPLPRYTLVDLGATDVKPELLAKFALPKSLAPMINNAGQISGNRTEEGFVRDFNHGELSPHIQQKKAYCYCLNNQGDILASLERKPSDTEWVVWVHENLRNRRRYRIEAIDLQGSNLYMRALNDKKLTVGALNPAGSFRPALWSPQAGFHTLSHYIGWDMKGVAYGVNNQGTVVGSYYNAQDNPPFAWNNLWGLEVLKNYRLTFEIESHRDITGPIRFADIVLTEDDRIYGNLWTDDPDLGAEGRRYLAYWWEPKTKTFRYLDLAGMRINAVNAHHTLAGSLNGEATICRRGDVPCTLSSLVANIDPEWKLHEASSINDAGDIVGYGEYKGSTHLYLLKATK